MGRVKLRVTVLAVMASTSLMYMPTEAPAGHTGAVVGGLVVGAAIGAALSKKHKHVEKIYVPGYGPPPVWTQTFSPKPGVLCYPAQRACYDAGGAYNPKWTWNTFGR